MSLVDIGSAGITKIFKCLKADFRNVDSLRKTSKSFNILAISLGLHKLNNAYLKLAIEPWKFRRYSDRMGKNCVIRAIIKMRKPDNDPDCTFCACKRNKVFVTSRQRKAASDSEGPLKPCSRYKHVTDSDGSGKEDIFRIGNSSRRKRNGTDDTDEEWDSEADIARDKGRGTPNIMVRYCSCKTWYIVAEETWEFEPRQKRFTELFSRLLKRVNSIEKLKVRCWRLNDHEIIFLNQLQQLRLLKKLVLFNCHLHVERDSFYGFLRSSQLCEVILSCKYTKYRLDDEFLFNMNRVTLIGVYGKKQRFLPGLTNCLLEKWVEQPPTSVTMRGFHSKFTIEGLLRLVEALQQTTSKFEYTLEISSLDANGYRALLYFLQRRRKITWHLTGSESFNLAIFVALFPNNSYIELDIKLSHA